MILGRNLSFNAQACPEKIAVIDQDGISLTHQQFAQRAFRYANAFHSAGLANANVAILARNSIAFLETYFGCACIGACLVAVNFHLKPHDIDNRLAHARVRALVVDEEFASVLQALSPAVREALGERIYVIGDAAGMLRLEELVLGFPPRPPRDVRVDPEDPLYIGYTSGTTGPPKGAVISHRAVVVGFLYKALECGLTERDISLNPGPFWHSAPRDFACLAIYLGGTCIVTRRFDPVNYLQDVARHKVSNSFLVPTMLQMIAEVESDLQIDTSSLRTLVTAGAPLPTHVKERIIKRFGPILIESYGATETRMVTSIKAHELLEKNRCVGRPTRDVEICLMDPDGKEMPVGEVGEVFIRGPGLFSGYFGDPDRTRSAHRGDWFSLGDMGRVDEQGYLYLVDRKQDMIISGGENIFPNDLEEVLLQRPEIKEVAVIGTPDAVWGEAVTAVVVPKEGHEIDAEALTTHCAALLPGYMKPRRVEVVKELPRNPVGKILRSVLRQQYDNPSPPTTM